MKKNVFIVTIISILLLNLIISAVYANNISDLTTDKTELQNQIKQNNIEIKEIQAEKSEVAQQIDKIDGEISTHNQELSILDEQISNLENSISKTTEELRITEENYKLQNKLFDQRLVAIYETGDITYLDILLSSSDVIDLLSTYYRMEELASYDTDLLNSIQIEKEKIQSAKQILEDNKQEIQTAKTAEQDIATSLSKAKQTKNTYISQLTADEKKTQQENQKHLDEIKKIEQEIAKLIPKSSATNIYTGGVMLWPVPGAYKISCGYLGYAGHYAIDITDGTSTVENKTVVAASDGKVVISKSLINSSGNYYSYGNYIVIDHGGGISTLYAHGNKRLVNVGDTVKKGQSIMTVGNTGNSFGAHLHFEVRKNGIYQNPINYLK